MCSIAHCVWTVIDDMQHGERGVVGTNFSVLPFLPTFFYEFYCQQAIQKRFLLSHLLLPRALNLIVQVKVGAGE